jgi:hypothetical protein
MLAGKLSDISGKREERDIEGCQQHIERPA